LIEDDARKKAIEDYYDMLMEKSDVARWESSIECGIAPDF